MAPTRELNPTARLICHDPEVAGSKLWCSFAVLQSDSHSQTTAASPLPTASTSERKTGLEPAIRPSASVRVRDGGLDLLRNAA